MLTAHDLDNHGAISTELKGVAQRVASEREVSGWIGPWLAQFCGQVGDTGADDLQGVTEHDWAALQGAALRLASVVFHGDDLGPAGFRRRVALGVEELRFRLARVAERRAFDPNRPIAEVVAQLDESLTLTQAEKGHLVLVSDRTWQRWMSGASQPAGNEATQLRLVARLVGELGGLLTATGAVRWAARGHATLDGRTPLQALRSDDELLVAEVFRIVAAARAGAAA